MMKNTEQSDLVIKRIQKAVSVGLKIKAISDSVEDLSAFRVASVVNPLAYRSSTTFTAREVREINKALDKIKNAI